MMKYLKLLTLLSVLVFNSPAQRLGPLPARVFQDLSDLVENAKPQVPGMYIILDGSGIGLNSFAVFYSTNTVTATNTTTRIYSGHEGYSWELLPIEAEGTITAGDKGGVNVIGGEWVLEGVENVINVMDEEWGVTGDGSTDDSAGFQLAATAADGGVLFVPAGTYLIDSVELGGVDVVLDRGATLKMAANATSAMLSFTGTKASISGGTLDGNKLNQGGAEWFALVQVNDGTDFTSSKVTYYEGTFAGVRALNYTGRLNIDNCLFYNFAEHGGVLNKKLTTMVSTISSVQDARPFITITDSYFIQPTAPVTVNAAPGGIIIQGFDGLNSHPSCHIEGNYFQNLGQTYVGNHIGAIDLYEDVLNATIVGNRFHNNRYLAIKVQNSGRTVISDNIMSADVGESTQSVILYDPNQREQVDGVYGDAIISRNVIEDDGTYGIFIQGVGNTVRDVLCIDNIIRGPGGGILVSNGEGPVTVSRNNIYVSKFGATDRAGIHVVGFSGDIHVYENYIEATDTTAFSVGSEVGNAVVHAGNNTFKALTAGRYGMVLAGVEAAYIYSGKYEGVTTAVTFIDDATTGENIGTLLFDRNHNIVSGTLAYTAADIDTWLGTVMATGSPESVYSFAAPGLFQRTDIPSIWIKSTTGTGNTGMRPLLYGSSGVVTSGDFAATFASTVLWVSSSAAVRTITLPEISTGAYGRYLYIGKSDSSANGVVVQPAGTDTLYGGNVTLTSQYEGRLFLCTTTGWVPLTDDIGLTEAEADLLYVGLTGNETIAGNKTFSGAIIQPVDAVAALDIDWSVGNVHSKTIGANSTFTFSNATAGQWITVVVTASGAFTATWPTVKWKGGAAPTQTSTSTDIYTFFYDGTSYHGAAAQDFQ